MKVHRFYIDKNEIDISKARIALSIKDNKDLIHQWINVLKFSIGEKVILFSNYTDDYVFEIININKKECILSFIELIAKQKDQNINNNVFLHIPIIKKDNLYMIVEKCTEIGIKNFCPILSKRTENKNLESFIKDIEKDRLSFIIKESLEQSGQNILPIISEIQKIEDNIESILSLDKESMIIVADFSEKKLSYILKHNFKNNHKNIHIFIGPEGGWTLEESMMFQKYETLNENRFFIARLTDTILRAETACIYCASLLL